MSHRILTADDIPGFVAGRPELAGWGDVLDVSEIGDGNLNNVWRVRCASGSVVLKQSMPHVRIDPTWALTPTRIVHEAASYATWQTFAPGVAPELYAFDEDLFAMVVEDLGAHAVWRDALNRGSVHPEAAGELGVFLARTAFHTGPLGGHDPARIAELRARGENPTMTRLMADVVFAFPYEGHPHNSYAPEVGELVDALRSDADHREAVAALRERWSGTQDALVHGDLHTGSVMVAEGSARVIDSEFSFYGPIAWDVGELLGNLLLAAVRAVVTTGAPCPRRAGLGEALWAGFDREVRELSSRLDGPSPATWLSEVRRDAVGYAGLEMVRRIVGSGKAEDVSTLGAAEHAVASRVALQVGRELVRAREELHPRDCVALVWAAAAETGS
jgi:5-methylthioribose kinase